MSNTEKFFSLYNSDSEVRSKVARALELYPGSLEIREAVAEDVLLPIAAEYGLPFQSTVSPSPCRICAPTKRKRSFRTENRI